MKQQVIRWLMKRFERFPRPDDYERLSEIFNHPAYVNGSVEKRREIQRRSALAKYEDEKQFRWETYFGMDIEPLLRGKFALDLGCFTGGRAVAWVEHYHLGSICGVDVRPDFVQAGSRFATERNVKAYFVTSVGEHLPFRDTSFDAILSFDVFEHTRNPEGVLIECRRVLRPGGRLFVVFPGYFHPLEHHLSLVTYTPFLHYFFSGQDLVRAYNEIIAERGEAAAWYARRTPGLASWELGVEINGTTVQDFRKMIGRTNWIVEHRPVLPFLRIGRGLTERRFLRALSYLWGPCAHVPILEEMLCHRIVYILCKP